MKKAFTFLALISLLLTPSAAQWEIIGAGDLDPIGDTILNDVFFLSRDVGYLAAGEAHLHGGYGSIFRTTDGGDTWEMLFNSDIYCPTSILFTNEMTGFFTSDGAWYDGTRLFRTLDGGTHWEEILSDASGGLFFVNESVGFVRQYQTVLKTTDGGDTWDTIYYKCDEQECPYIYNSFFLNETKGWLLAQGDKIIRYTAPESWIESNHGEIISPRKLFFVNETTGWLMAGYRYSEFEYSFGLYKTTDGGLNWTAIPEMNYLIHDLYFENEHHGWAVGEDIEGQGILLETYDQGLSWNIKADKLPGRLSKFSSQHGQQWAVGQNGLILRNNGFPYWIEWARLENPSAYLIPGEETAFIGACIMNPESYPIRATTYIQDMEETKEIQVSMDHHSGNFWMAEWPLDHQEAFYKVKVVAERTDIQDSSFNYSLGTAFTSAGPMKIHSMHYPWYEWEDTDTIPNPGDTLRLALEVKNTSFVRTIPAAALSIAPVNDLITPVFYGSYYDFWRDFEPGEILPAETYIAIAEEAEDGSVIPLEIKLYSNGKAYWRDTVYVELEGGTSLEPVSALDYNIYPNPATDRILIESGNTLRGPTRIEIVDLSGKLICKDIGNHFENPLIVNLSGVEPGLYLVKISHAKNQCIKKLLIE